MTIVWTCSNYYTCDESRVVAPGQSPEGWVVSGGSDVYCSDACADAAEARDKEPKVKGAYAGRGRDGAE